MKDAETVTFAGATVDRAAHLRNDPEALKAMLAQADARVLPVWRNKPLLEVADGVKVAWLAADSPLFGGDPGETIFLGLEDGKPRFAKDVPDWAEGPDGTLEGFLDDTKTRHPALSADYEFRELRAEMGSLAPGDAGNAAMARGVFAWHERHRFCANCGAPSALDQGGWRRICGACSAQHFPRIDPVVIMLVTSGNSVLLGRSPGWPEGMYSLLAGFMEPGETIEAAVRREVFEEAGIAVGAVRYLASQPWPFPSSLMIGCAAEASGTDLRLDPVELEDAKFVSREDVMESLYAPEPAIRPARPGAIARFLIEHWLADTLD